LGARIPKLRDFFQLLLPNLDFFASAKKSKKDRQEARDNLLELKETLQEVDLDELWARSMRGLLDDEVALDAAELTFLFGRGKGKTAEKSAKHFINRLCNLGSLQHVKTPVERSVMDEVLDIEHKVERIVTHSHACRKGLEQKFQKLRPYIAKSRQRTIMMLKDKSTVGQYCPAEEDRQVRYVFKEGMYIGEVYYLVEMSTVSSELHVSAYDAGSERTLDLTVKDDVYQRVLVEAGWDHSNIAQRLRHGSMSRVAGGEVRLELGPPPATNIVAAKPRQTVARIRPLNSLFPGGDDGPKPPVQGQLKVAAAVLDGKKKDPFGAVNIGNASSRPIIDGFLKANPPKRIE